MVITHWQVKMKNEVNANQPDTSPIKTQEKHH